MHKNLLLCSLRNGKLGTEPANGTAGFTLIETIVSLTILVLLISFAVPVLARFAAEQRVISATHDVLALMRLARAEAMTGGPVLLCDANHTCADFKPTQHLLLMRAVHSPPHEKPQMNIAPLTSLKLPDGIRLAWRRFRGDALLFHRNGILHFQNGHFLVCNQHASRRIVMNWAGRPRIELPGQDINCPQ